MHPVRLGPAHYPCGWSTAWKPATFAWKPVGTVHGSEHHSLPTTSKPLTEPRPKGWGLNERFSVTKESGVPKPTFKSIDNYLAAQPETARRILESVRSTIRKALPDAEELISYQRPAYKLRGDLVIYFAGWKHHYSLYPVHTQLVEAFKDQLKLYELNYCGTLRFPLAQPVP